MIKSFLKICLVALTACNFKPGAGRNEASTDKIFQLKLNPHVGATYDYEISNENLSKFEVDGNTVENSKKTDCTVSYFINMDSSGDFVISIRFKKIHIHTKKNEEESDVDADNGEGSMDPVERMMGQLKNATITATTTNTGEVKSITGYKEIADEYLSHVTDADLNAKIAAQKQWQQLVENSLVKNNLNKLFKSFPDSAVHIGDIWKIASKDSGEMSTITKNIFKLTAIEDGKAIVKSSGVITSDSTNLMVMGYPLSSNLNGEQKGEYEMDVQSGMLTYCKIATRIEGAITITGKEVPYTSNVKIKIKKKD